MDGGKSAEMANGAAGETRSVRADSITIQFEGQSSKDSEHLLDPARARKLRTQSLSMKEFQKALDGADLTASNKWSCRYWPCLEDLGVGAQMTAVVGTLLIALGAVAFGNSLERWILIGVGGAVFSWTLFQVCTQMCVREVEFDDADRVVRVWTKPLVLMCCVQGTLAECPYSEVAGIRIEMRSQVRYRAKGRHHSVFDVKIIRAGSTDNNNSDENGDFESVVIGQYRRVGERISRDERYAIIDEWRTFLREHVSGIGA